MASRAGIGAIAAGGQMTAAAARGGAYAAGAGSTAYGLASTGQSGLSGAAAGLAGIGKAAGSAAIAPMKQMVSRETGAFSASFQSGARDAASITGGVSTAGTIGGDTESAAATLNTSAPAWAERIKNAQGMSHGLSTAAHAVRSGDSHGAGHSVDLSEKES
jgi:type IV secretion system protein TrbL